MVEEGPESMDVPHTLAPWAFNGATGQWYAMRPLHHPAPEGKGGYGGFGSNYAFATEYGLALLAPTKYNRVYSYSAYSNQWTRLPLNPANTEFPPFGGNICVAYDLKHRKMVFTYGNSSSINETWAYDVGSKSWTKLATNTSPANGNPSWYFEYSATTYDRKNGVVIYLRSHGDQTWALNLDDNTWTNMQPTGNPPSCGNMGEGLAYDPKRNATLVYTNKNDEVWTYKYGNGIANRPDPVENPAGVTDQNGITITWSAPAAGASPVQYYIYRAEWQDNATNSSGLIPGPYQKIDSTTQTTCTDNNTAVLTQAGVFHSYYISGVSAQGIESDPSTPVYTRLRVPMGLVATAYSKNRVLLRWKPKYEPDLAGYNVHRFQKFYPFNKQMMDNKINTTPITGTPYFIDSTVSLCAAAYCPDSMAMYVVTAVNRLGKSSGLSPFALTTPDWVTNMWVDTVNKVVTWSPLRSGNIANYRVYEGRQGTWNGGSANPSQVATVTDTFWSYAGRTVSAYKVRAFNTIAQLGYFSDVMAVQTKDQDNFGMLRLDFQAHRPTVDTFYNDVPPLSVALEGGGAGAAADAAVTAAPNPFNPAVVITWANVRAINESPLQLAIYTTHGRMVHQVNQIHRGRYTWDASGMPSGLYIIRARIGERILEKKVTLIR